MRTVLLALVVACAAPHRADLHTLGDPGAIARAARSVMGPRWKPVDKPPECILRDVPPAPELAVVLRPSDARTILEGFYVSARQMEDIVVWYSQIRDWTDDVSICLRALARVTPEGTP